MEGEASKDQKLVSTDLASFKAREKPLMPRNLSIRYDDYLVPPQS